MARVRINGQFEGHVKVKRSFKLKSLFSYQTQRKFSIDDLGSSSKVILRQKRIEHSLHIDRIIPKKNVLYTLLLRILHIIHYLAEKGTLLLYERLDLAGRADE